MALPYPLHHLVSLTTKQTEKKKALCTENLGDMCIIKCQILFIHKFLPTTQH